MNNGNWNGEVKINKDILKYNEQVFMGLNLKQTISGAVAMIVAALVYFVTHNIFGRQLAIIFCAVAASPVAAIGFLSFNGLTFMQLLKAVVQHYSMPDKLLFRAKNFYQSIITLDKYISSKEDKRKNAKNIPANQTDGKELLQGAENGTGNNSYQKNMG